MINSAALTLAQVLQNLRVNYPLMQSVFHFLPKNHQVSIIVRPPGEMICVNLLARDTCTRDADFHNELCNKNLHRSYSLYCNMVSSTDINHGHSYQSRILLEITRLVTDIGIRFKPRHVQVQDSTCALALLLIALLSLLCFMIMSEIFFSRIGCGCTCLLSTILFWMS